MLFMWKSQQHTYLEKRAGSNSEFTPFPLMSVNLNYIELAISHRKLKCNDSKKVLNGKEIKIKIG